MLPNYETSDSQAPLNSIIPQPEHITCGEGAFLLTGETVIVADASVEPETRLLADFLSQATGFSLRVTPTAGDAPNRIVLSRNAAPGDLGEEGYRLRVTPDAVTITAATSAGVFYGGQTLLQLLPVSIFSHKVVVRDDWAVPCVTIEDRPRFGWRGAMLDVSRHFLPLEFVKKFIDLLALHKLNVLHLHLNDDQGWRLEIKKYPKLTEVGARRAKTLVGFAEQSPADADLDPTRQTFDDVPYGGFYTQEEAREMVAYARAT